jgi:SAM-dependent methyltransferase
MSTTFAELKARQAAVWGSAPWERLAADAAGIHDDQIARLGVTPGERWLDLATGTGAIALRAARRGAAVTGQDLAPGLINTARRLAAEEDLEVVFEVGDCEELPCADASFDVVSSAQGAVFAPDHRAVARQLARVCRPGGRIGLTTWRPGGSIAEQLQLLARFSPPPPPGAGLPLDWGRPAYVTGLLGNTFHLEFFEGQSPQRGSSPEALWDLFSTSAGPIKAVAESLDADGLRELKDAWMEYFGRYTTRDGSVAAPREYLIILGTRKHNQRAAPLTR